MRGWIDLHHPAHPKAAEELQGERGTAVRGALGQLVNWEDHHNRWHQEDCEPDVLPRTDSEAARYVVFAAGGFLHKGIRFRQSGIEVVTLTNQQRERLWHSGERKVLRPDAIRSFVVSQVMDQPLHPADEELEEVFFEAYDPRDIRIHGHDILALKVGGVVSNFADDYETASQAGLLHPAAPARATRLVHNIVGNFPTRDRIVQLMHSNGPLLPLPESQNPTPPPSFPTRPRNPVDTIN
ncbi:MAG TPA: hypothetical protein VK674_05230 [Candidatus Limnocylindria bacterium]|nr:hypothetical protein [Candidatus Limnocylindria bacterium]